MVLKLGSKLAELRKAKGLTQAEVAKAINVDVSTVRNLERDRSGSEYLLRVINLCNTLGCDIKDLK
ncbi:MAG: hypothetical protein RLZZ171_2110 [Cyanobacteriota bacterium]|jgi:transcriptional regulator with XRE-family HTH domain